MTTFQSCCVVIFGILAYVLLVDENVAVYLTLGFKIIKINIEKMFWMIRLHPRNPITNMMMKWKYDRIARELRVEMECKATELNDNSKINK